MKYKEIQTDLKKTLKSSRYAHTMGVVETAVHLAGIYNYSEKKAKYAALLHDCAKHLSDQDKIDLCLAHNTPIKQVELDNPSLLHAKCGAILAKEKYGIEDEEILHAIEVHTTGVPAMNLLDLILFVSDYIEPGRDQAPHLKELRKMAEKDLTQTAYCILKDTVDYLNSRKNTCLDSTTMETYQYYRQICSLS